MCVCMYVCASLCVYTNSDKSWREAYIKRFDPVSVCGSVHVCLYIHTGKASARGTLQGPTLCVYANVHVYVCTHTQSQR